MKKTKSIKTVTAEVYAVKDALNGFILLTLDDNDQTATRNFAYSILNPGDILNFAPKDFDLYHMGTFDINTGSFTQDDIPQLVVRGANIALAYKDYGKDVENDG